jgi:hypothetical protein
MAVTLNANSSTGFIATSDTSGVLQLQTGGTTAVTVDASQQVGIGVTPSAWSGSVVLQMTGPSLWGYSGLTHLSTNTYYDGANYKYIATNFVTDAYQLNGAHVWRSAASGTAGTNVTFSTTTTLNANGVLALSGASTSANGVGIAFPATQSASSDVNTLDDYEEGTWTPTLSSTGTPPTVTSYAERIGYYTKVGNLVTVICELRVTLSAAGTGTVAIVLPFTPRAGTLAPAALGLRDLLTGTISTYTSGDTLFFSGATYVTGGSPYLVFFMTYQVA